METDKLIKSLTDSGKIIEAGWLGLQYAWLPKDAPQVQINEMRHAFFAGAQYLFSSMMQFLEPGDDPTDKDLDRITLIDQELRDFINTYMIKNLKPEGGVN